MVSEIRLALCALQLGMQVSGSFVCVYVSVCVWVFVLPLPILPLKRRKDAGFQLWIQIYWTDFTDWSSVLPSNLMKEISPNPEDLTANT